MKIYEWWPLVSAETRHWLVAHNGEPLTPQITSNVMLVASGATGPEWWAGESADGPQLTDAAVDWIEAVANGKNPLLVLETGIQLPTVLEAAGWQTPPRLTALPYGGKLIDNYLTPLAALPARGQLGARLRRLVEAGTIELHTGFGIGSLKPLDSHVTVEAVDGRTLEADIVVPCTGFRPDLDILRELRLEPGPRRRSTRGAGPADRPRIPLLRHRPPARRGLLAHPDKDFYIVGMKSYGRAPTFLLATGYEQVRSVAAALAGDREAADTVQLELPETGVCSDPPAPAATSPRFPSRGRPAPLRTGLVGSPPDCPTAAPDKKANWPLTAPANQPVRKNHA